MSIGAYGKKDDITLNYGLSQYQAVICDLRIKLMYSVDETFSDDEVDFGICYVARRSCTLA